MEIKQETAQIIETLPNEVLEEVLAYLRQIEKTGPPKMRLSAHLATILDEDREASTKLAK